MPDPGITEVTAHGVHTPEGTVFDPDAPACDAPLVEVEAVEREQRALLVKVYTYMVVGLLISAAVAHFAMGNADTVTYVRTHALGFQALFFLEVVAVGIISEVIEQLPIALTSILFLAYAAFNGVSFSVFFLFIPPNAVAFGLLVSALTFAATAMYAHSTGADLGTLRSLFVMLCVGLMVMCGANLLLRNEAVYWATSYVGVLIFATLANYHAQDFRDFDFAFEDDDAENHKAAPTGALLLYLDVVNFYIMAMRLLGRGRGRR